MVPSFYLLRWVNPHLFIFYFLIIILVIIMGFGKRVVKKDVSKDIGNVKKPIDKNGSINGNNSSINNSNNISDTNIKKKRTYGFMKKTSSKSLGLLFGQTKEEKLELFIKNIKIIHPNMPKFWLKKEIEEFKKKFNIEGKK